MVVAAVERQSEYSPFSTVHRREFYPKNTGQLPRRPHSAGPGARPASYEFQRVSGHGISERADERERQRRAMLGRQRPMSACDMKRIAVLAMSHKRVRPAGGGVSTSLHQGNARHVPRPKSATPMRSDSPLGGGPVEYVREPPGNGAAVNNRGTSQLLESQEGHPWQSHTRSTFIRHPPYVPKQGFKADGEKYQLGGPNIIAYKVAPTQLNAWQAAGWRKQHPAESQQRAATLQHGFTQAHVRAARSLGMGAKAKRTVPRPASAYARSIAGILGADTEPVLNPTVLTSKQVRHVTTRRLDTEGQQKCSISHGAHVAQETRAIPNGGVGLRKEVPSCKDAMHVQDDTLTLMDASVSSRFTQRLRKTVQTAQAS